MKQVAKGSTLLELLIILVIVGVVVQLALPHYGVFIEKSRARERFAALLSLQSQVESCYFETRDYEGCVAQLAVEPPHLLVVEATPWTYRLVVHGSDETVACYAYETNHEHRLVVTDATGEPQACNL
jgi:Tfp pilus assembly protein PilE